MLLSFRAKRSEVENGPAGEAATQTRRPEGERTGSERIKYLEEKLEMSRLRST